MTLLLVNMIFLLGLQMGKTYGFGKHAPNNQMLGTQTRGLCFAV